MNNIVDLTETQNSGIYANVSTFFKDMSYGQFKMIGKAYYVQAPHTLAWYQTNHSGSEAAYSAQDAIQLLDQTVDFADFDRWIDASYNHTQGSDEILDMVFICYRRWYICPVPRNYCSSFLAEGWYEASLPGVVYVDNSARRIVSSHAVDALNMIQYPRFEHLVHEFGHVWGLNHQYAPGFWSLMGQRFPTNTPFMNSLEREQLGWISFHDITSSQPDSLRDFGSYGDAYRMSLGNSEYFILENHQTISQYDFPAIDAARGLYVLRQFPYGSAPYEGNLKVETASGRYDWTNPSWTNYPANGVRVPVFQRGQSNRTLGLNVRDPLYAVDPITGQGGYNLLHAQIDNNGQTIFGGFYRGNVRDVYNPNYCTVFSPWSHPSTCLQSGTLSSIGFEVLPSSSSIFDIQFFVGNPVSASPSKPQDLRVTVSGSPPDDHPKLTWRRNLEPDAAAAPYKVWRKITGDPSWDWTLIATVSDTTFTDNNIGIGRKKYYSIQYKIKAVDTQGMESVFSDPVSISAQYLLWKAGLVENIEEKPESFYLSQNVPNPFNPSTNIKFEIPEEHHATLKVFNTLGQEVATLVNGFQSAGSYLVPFDASQLSSGVYIYTLKAGNYTASKKLLLMK